MYVHRKDGLIIEFNEYKSGLYFYDVADQGKNITSSDINYNYLTSYSLLQTVEANKIKYTKREVKSAESARKLMKQLGHPSQQYFEQYLRGNLIRNCPLSVDNIKRASDIFGPEVQSLQGKMVKRKGDHLPTCIPIEMPE